MARRFRGSRLILGFVLLLALVLAGGYAWLWQADQYQRDGVMQSRGPRRTRPRRARRVGRTVHLRAIAGRCVSGPGLRDGAGPAVPDSNSRRYLAHGRLAELIGEAGLGLDVRMRVAGIPRHARRHAALLQGEERRRRELYLEGLNAYVRDYTDEHPVSLRLLGITPQPWTLEDTVTLSYFLNMVSSSNPVTPNWSPGDHRPRRT